MGTGTGTSRARPDPDGRVPYAFGVLDPGRGAARHDCAPCSQPLTDLPVERVLVSHGPLVLGDRLASLRRATT